MRKGTDSPRFPHSAALFKFCLQVMTARRSARVHDQEVGNILNYNPSDTSHWKRGKKAVKSIFALDALARTLDVSSELVQDLADGVINLDEAWYEFEECEDIRKANALLNPELKVERRTRLMRSEEVCARLLSQARVTSTPIYLPEIVEVLPFLTMISGDVAEKLARSARAKPGNFLIRYRKGDMRAHTRAAIAREISRIILFSERESLGLLPRHPMVEFLEMIDFSNALLVPRERLVEETAQLSARVDVVKALSETFWVPKAMIRTRLKQLALLGLADQELMSPEVGVRRVQGELDQVRFPSAGALPSAGGLNN